MAAGLRFVVLDRPDPIRADRVGGPVLDAGQRSFTGQPGLPVQPGLTMGENLADLGGLTISYSHHDRVGSRFVELTVLDRDCVIRR